MITLPTIEDDFDYFVRAPLQWLIKGQTLRRAAAKLFERYQEAYSSLDELDGAPIDEAATVMADLELYQPPAMLAGFSLEVTIKALIVAKHPDRIQPGMKGKDWTAGKTNNGHDLVALARSAGIDTVDADFLNLLTQFSIWKGRYPSTLEGTPMYGRQSLLEHFPGTHWVVLIDQFEQAYSTIHDQAQAAVKEYKSKSE